MTPDMLDSYFRPSGLGASCILTGSITFWRDEYITKVVYKVELGVLTVRIHVRMTPYPPRLRLQTSWKGGILMTIFVCMYV